MNGPQCPESVLVIPSAWNSDELFDRENQIWYTSHMLPPKTVASLLPHQVRTAADVAAQKAASPDIVTPNGSIRFTSDGIVLESGGQQIKVTRNGIQIRSAMSVEITAGTNIDCKGGTVLQIRSGADLTVNGSGNVTVSGGATTSIKGAIVTANGKNIS